MTKRPAVKFAISLDAELFDRLEARRAGEARSAFIARTLDAALSNGEGQRGGSRPSPGSGASSASRRAPGDARPAAAAADGQDGTPSAGLGHARTSAEVKRGVRPIPKAKGKR